MQNSSLIIIFCVFGIAVLSLFICVLGIFIFNGLSWSDLTFKNRNANNGKHNKSIYHYAHEVSYLEFLKGWRSGKIRKRIATIMFFGGFFGTMITGISASFIAGGEHIPFGIGLLFMLLYALKFPVQGFREARRKLDGKNR